MKRKISSIMCIVLNVLLFNYNSVYALQKGQTTGLREQMYSIPNNNGLFNAGSEIAGYIVYAAIVISVIVLMVKGIKFITSSPEGKADVKKELIPWAIGLVILFSMNIVLNAIKDIAMRNINTL